jgi:phosphoglycolate phosphatase-like HAD superfamily hydrolase
MPFDAVLFDFDGTLVDSAEAKYRAFFAIFPATPAHRAIVENVLSDDPDGSRHKVIPLMAKQMREAGLGGASNAQLILHYGEEAEAAVAKAHEFPGASDMLAQLAPRMALHLCSNTPEGVVRGHVKVRGWSDHFRSVDGYPTTKKAKLAQMLSEGGYETSRVAVVGDGLSDEEAARVNDCRFLAVRQPSDLMAAGRILGAAGV